MTLQSGIMVGFAAFVDYEHWDAHIDLYLKMLEFDDAEDMAFVKEIGEKAHYLCITPEEGGGFRVHIMINYFEELTSEDYGSYLKYETLMEDEELAPCLIYRSYPRRKKQLPC